LLASNASAAISTARGDTLHKRRKRWQTNQVFTINYTDGTSSSFTQSVSDWYTAPNYAGESAVLTMPYRVLRNGALDNRTFYLYGYSFALNPAKTVASLTLPKTRNSIVLAIDLQ